MCYNKFTYYIVYAKLAISDTVIVGKAFSESGYQDKLLTKYKSFSISICPDIHYIHENICDSKVSVSPASYASHRNKQI